MVNGVLRKQKSNKLAFFVLQGNYKVNELDEHRQVVKAIDKRRVESVRILELVRASVNRLRTANFILYCIEFFRRSCRLRLQNSLCLK